ncbi:MAG: DEAD/DEAH box helicase, partial [Bifidobacteriaceae bacterium]|nr:DEAD/DEAH box helicase [Bifidobacteriaceae bacterium]
MNRLLNALGTVETRFACVTHVEVTSARAGAQQAWPEWTPEWVRSGYQFLGVSEPWVHQVEAMESGRLGHTVIATSTGSGKSLALWTPVLAALDTPRPLGRITELRSRPAALYLAPTKALAADQDTALTGLFQAAGVPGWLAATCDGDTPRETRRYLQSHADILLTNPDFLHFSLLPAHARWAGLLRGLRYVIIDELHAYRGVMGAHVAWVLRRLRRLARHYGADPVFLAASATVCQPDAALARLIGSEIQQVTAVTEDTSEQGEQTLVLWRPEITADPENVTSPENPANLGNPQPAASPTVGNQAASDWQTDDSDDNAASATETSPIQTETPRRSATLEAARLL